MPWITQARENNPLVRAQTAVVEADRLEVDRANSDHLPTVDLLVTASRNSSNHSLTTPDDYSTRARQGQISFQVNVPIFSGGAVIAKVSEARSNLSKAEADLEAAVRTAASDAQHAFVGINKGLAQVDALTVAVQSGASALKGNQAGFKAGVRANVDVLNAEQQLFAAQRDLSKARYEVLLQSMKLKAAAGILGEADVASINALLE